MVLVVQCFSHLTTKIFALNSVDADMEPGEPKKLCKASQEEGDEEEEEICHTDDGASTWLHNLGLDTAKYRSLDPNKVKLYPCLFYVQ